MRKTIACLFVLLAFRATALHAGLNYWSPIGPFGGEIRSMAADPKRPNVLYAGTRGSVFKSTDGGATWRRTSRGLKGEVNALAVSADGSIVYAGTYGGLFVSRNGGATWVNPRPAVTWFGVLSLAVDPRDARRVWAGAENGLAWSRDAGVTWTYADLDEPSISRVPDVVLDPRNPDVVYAANEPLEDESILGVVKTTNGGATWTFLDARRDGLLYGYDGMRLAVDPTAPNVVYVSTDSAAAPPNTFRSTDGGTTWRETPGGYPVAVDASGITYAGRMRSVDHGATWTQVAAPPDSAQDYVPVANVLWAPTYSFGIFRSTDRAATWTPSSEGLHATSPISITVDNETPRVIYAETWEMGVRKTLSSGERWRAAAAGLPPHLSYTRHGGLLALDPRRPQTIYHLSNGLARSDDGGSHWTTVNATHFDANAIEVDAAGTIYLGGPNLIYGSCRVARSDDRGATFRCLLPFTGDTSSSWPDTWLSLDRARPGSLWVLEARDRLWKSNDGGDHWTEVHPLGLARAGDPRSLWVDPSNPAHLLLGTTSFSSSGDQPERVWRSDDGGLSWRPWGRVTPEDSTITRLIVDASKPSIVYAAVAHHHDPRTEADRSGVYLSRDGGRTFTSLRDGLPSGTVVLVQDPKDPRKLYAGTPWNGIYTFTRKQ
ncbi:MAG TPA: hypothetical protein VFS60_14920 [Thermoanaerobaculia bacterium]|nr:hypothetical protein [Thermoanaerobaculia bacterium]